MLKWLLIVLMIPVAHAEFEYSAELQWQVSSFDDDGDEKTEDLQNTLYGRFMGAYEGENYKVNISAFGRTDTLDESRQMSSFDETFVQYVHESYTFNIGWNVFNWSVMEFFHPVDTINSRNLDVNAEKIERLGQPSLVINKEFENSYLQLLVLLDVVDPILPEQSNRNGFGMTLKHAQYVTDDYTRETNPNFAQYGMRYQHTFDNFDLDLHFIRKMGTQHPLIAAPVQVLPSNLNDIKVYPFYFPVNQLGMTVQGVFDEFTYKLEAVNYDFDSTPMEILIPIDVTPGVAKTDVEQIDHTAGTWGLEYSKTYANNHEGMFFFEYQFILGTTMEQARNLTPFQRDIGFGYRHNFNDFNSNELTIGLIHDVDSYDETLFNLEYTFRFMDNYKFFANLRVIDAPPVAEGLSGIMDANGLKPLREADNVSVAVIRYF
jgi:hypothetical protein